ncbi:21623_t:CDS:2, partial [Gigaspora rosea]
GDIVMFVGKFVVENLEQYFTVSYTYAITAGEEATSFRAKKKVKSNEVCEESYTLKERKLA